MQRRQALFWKRFGKEPSLGFPMHLTNLHALRNDQKAGSRSEWTSHQLAFRLLHTRHQHLTDGLTGIDRHFGLTIPPPAYILVNFLGPPCEQQGGKGKLAQL